MSQKTFDHPRSHWKNSKRLTGKSLLEKTDRKKFIWRDLVEKNHKKTCQIKTRWYKLVTKCVKQKPFWQKTCDKTLSEPPIQMEGIDFFKKSNQISIIGRAFCLSELKSHLNLASLCFLMTSVSYIYFPLDPSEMMFLFTMRKSKGE